MCTHFLLFFVGPYRAVGTICNDHRFISYAAGGLGGAKPPPSRSRAEVWWGPGGKAPWSSGNLAF